jgi:hypothetical protein
VSALRTRTNCTAGRAARAEPRFALLAQAAGQSPEAACGLNIEGLAATAGAALLIGFRNPLDQGRALLLPLLNPSGRTGRSVCALAGRGQLQARGDV